jgi:vacuolar protein sorting-associated protein 18
MCREKNLTEACVQLSSILGLWESAVELALTVNIELAKKIANMVEDLELKRNLWLKIGILFF